MDFLKKFILDIGSKFDEVAIPEEWKKI